MWPYLEIRSLQMIKLRWGIREGFIPIWLCPYKGEKFGQRQTQSEGRRWEDTGRVPCVDRRSGWCFSEPSMPTVASTPPEAREKPRKILSHCPRRNQPHKHLALGLPASRPVRQNYWVCATSAFGTPKRNWKCRFPFVDKLHVCLFFSLAKGSCEVIGLHFLEKGTLNDICNP